MRPEPWTFKPRYTYHPPEPAPWLTWRGWAGIVAVFLGGLACLFFGAGCHLGEFLGTAEGRKSAEDTGSGAIEVLMNPANPMAWAKLLWSGAILTAGGLGLYKSPAAMRATGRGCKAVGGAIKRRLTKKPLVTA